MDDNPYSSPQAKQSAPKNRDPYRVALNLAIASAVLIALVSWINLELGEPLGQNWERILIAGALACALTIFWLQMEVHYRLGQQAGGQRSTLWRILGVVVAVLFGAMLIWFMAR
jgi:hypothetical protein